jgi:hypothetical protein
MTTTRTFDAISPATLQVKAWPNPPSAGAWRSDGADVTDRLGCIQSPEEPSCEMPVHSELS